MSNNGATQMRISPVNSNLMVIGCDRGNYVKVIKAGESLNNDKVMKINVRYTRVGFCFIHCTLIQNSASILVKAWLIPCS